MTQLKNSESEEKLSGMVTIWAIDKTTGKELDFIEVPRAELPSTNPSTSSKTPDFLYRHKVEDDKPIRKFLKRLIALFTSTRRSEENTLKPEPMK